MTRITKWLNQFRVKTLLIKHILNGFFLQTLSFVDAQGSIFFTKTTLIIGRVNQTIFYFVGDLLTDTIFIRIKLINTLETLEGKSFVGNLTKINIFLNTIYDRIFLFKSIIFKARITSRFTLKSFTILSLRDNTRSINLSILIFTYRTSLISFIINTIVYHFHFIYF